MKKISTEEYREARKKHLANLSPEEREELERKKLEAETESRKWREEFFKQHKELFKWYEDGIKANDHHEKAFSVLKEAIQSAVDHPDMSPEVKEFAEDLLCVMEDRLPFKYDLEAILHPLIEVVEKDTQSKSGSHAVTIRHEKNKKEREPKISKLREIWASGKYIDRDTCAEQEYSGLGFCSFGSARKALRNTPNPEDWYAKKKKT